MAPIDDHVKRRNFAKNKITKIITAVNKHIDTTAIIDPVTADLYLDVVTQQYDQIVEATHEISFLTTTDAEFLEQQAVIDEWDDKVIPLKATLIGISKPIPAATGSTARHTSNISLPKISLPTFDGKYEEWTSFADIFRATISSNPTLSGALKLQYLKLAVKGDALRIIHTFQITDDNYDLAWTALTERYDNQREIIFSVVTRLFSQPKITRESSQSLQKLLDTTQECYQILNVLGVPVDKWDIMLIHLVVERMDPDSRRRWAISLKGTQVPTYTELTDFLKQHIRGLLASTITNQPQQQQPQQSSGQTSKFVSTTDRRKPVSLSHHVSSESSQCTICKESHLEFQCPTFKSKTPGERHIMAKKFGLCFNCLRHDHGTKVCKSNSNCKTCNGRHNTLLHFERSNNRQSSSSNREESSVSRGGSRSSDQTVVEIHHSTTSFGPSNSCQVLLSTVVLKIKDSNGIYRPCRAFLDCGSESSFMTEKCANALGLRKNRTDVVLTGICSSSVGAARHFVEVELSSCINSETVKFKPLLLPTVTGIRPKYPLADHKSWTHIHGLQLADPKFYESGSVDILIGADIKASIMKNGRVVGPKNTPIAENTMFGWVLSGPVVPNIGSTPTISVNHISCETDDILTRFWELEELPAVKYLTPEEDQCEKHFISTHSRDSSGRFVCKFPFKDKISNLGSSRDIAVTRLMSVERRLESQHDYRQQYVKFMQDYEALGHMVEVHPNDNSSSSAVKNYLPHHFVLKGDSTSTKFRVVFDGSAKTTSGVSFNSCLKVGPTIQDDVFALILKFRLHLIALKADIAKFYRQFLIDPVETDYQRIVWRDSPAHPIKDYRLLTATYGTASAPFTATRCLKQLCEDEKVRFPNASKVLSRDSYVDDIMSGESTPERAIALQQQLCELVECGGMQLLKWVSSDPTVLDAIPQEIRESGLESLDFDTSCSFKTLGVKWNPATDNFHFAVTKPSKFKLTKRNLLSELAKVFDPLGWLSPITISAKITFQELWKLKIGWDDELPTTIQNSWSTYQGKLDIIKHINIPRCLIKSAVNNYQLHCFCDSSEKAYAAVVFLRTHHEDGSIIVRHVAAKTKVAPIKQVSLPRLELCGAVLGARLVTAVKQSLEIECSISAWSDSTVVLKWLASFPGRWHTFVANRVASVQDLIPTEQWHHVISGDNPADCASRGILASELKDLTLWWSGPEWLINSSFPIHHCEPDQQHVASEEKKPKVLVSHVSVEPSLLSKFSCLKKLQRVTAYCLRFIHNLKSTPSQRKHGPILFKELTSALHHWIIDMQAVSFPLEIRELTTAGEVNQKSKLKQLNPFLDQGGLLRVGGRIQNSDGDGFSKHPIILPHNHLLTKLIINHYHLKTIHGGFKLLWTTLQQEFWILRARDTIRHLVRQCVTCRKQRAESSKQLMGSLPACRVSPHRAFLHCGVDYAGPVILKAKSGRSRTTTKAYMALFVCMSTKAVHLEAVSDLSTASFLAAFRRFSSRRGISSHMYSDCGTNFIGADNELKQLVQSTTYNTRLAHQLSDQGITWNFNPPSAPHHGGLWEAGVKSVKYHLKRVVGASILTFEELQTVLCQIEACLNSRPLGAASTDSSDLSPLTPGHFLIGAPLIAVPDVDFTMVKVNRLTRWQQMQQMVQNFWKRWRLEYMTTLQQRFKWTSKGRNMEIGDLVVIKEDNLPPTAWRMGRITKIHPGNDDVVRVVTLKTSTGELQRPIVKLCAILYHDE